MQLITTNNRDLQLFQTNYLNEIFLWLEHPTDDQELFLVLKKIVNNDGVCEKSIHNIVRICKELKIENFNALYDYFDFKVKHPQFNTEEIETEKFKNSFFLEQYLVECDEERIKNSLDYFLDSYSDEKYPFIKEFVSKCKQARLSDV